MPSLRSQSGHVRRPAHHPLSRGAAPARHPARPHRGTKRSAPAPRTFSRRPRGHAFTDWLARAEPPGGWTVFALVLIALVGSSTFVWPGNPLTPRLRDVLGGGLPLAIVWPTWMAWSLARSGHVPLSKAAALGVLCVAWLVTLQLREGGDGGLVGSALLQTLDDGFGRDGGLVLLALASLVALVGIAGARRLVVALALAGSFGRRLIARGTPERERRPDRRTRVLEQPPFQPPPDRSPRRDLVILGPPGAAGGAAAPLPARPSASAAPRPAVAPPTARPTHPGAIVWNRPDPKMLEPASDGGAFSPTDLRARAKVIEETLASFNVEAHVVEVQQGPAITQFGLDPAPGVAVNRIVTRQHDLALRLGAPSLRVLAPVPGRPLVGLEVPNTSVAMVKLGDLLGAPMFGRARLPIGIGMDVSGKPVVGDLARMPHLLIAGATGSGKSVCINTLIASLLVSRTPDEIQLVLIDPKQVEMSQYKGLPHLRLPVVTDMQKVVATLRWTVLEMERRYNRFSEVGARNIITFNERFPEERLGYLVIIIDELADMMMTAADDVERLICRLAQLGRAAGVHLVVATQRPSVDVLTGLIKANLPTRIAFAVASQTDSRVIMDRAGAERLLGRGDALYQAGDEMNPRRVQGAFVSDQEIEALCTHWRGQALPHHTEEDEQQLEKLARQEDPEEKLLTQARELTAEHGDVSVSFLQRRLKIGAQKAMRIRQTLMADEAAARALPPPEEAG